MINDTGNIGYYLFHGTRHRKGVELMKDAMWKLDPGGEFTFSDRMAGIGCLVYTRPGSRAATHGTPRPLRWSVAVAVADVEWHALLYTPYRRNTRSTCPQAVGERATDSVLTGQTARAKQFASWRYRRFFLEDFRICGHVIPRATLQVATTGL